MTLFETERLLVKRLEMADRKCYAELFTDPKVLHLVPQKPLTENEIRNRFTPNLTLTKIDLSYRKCDFGLFVKGHAEMIGLALFLLNEKGEKELGYRFGKAHWGKGYGTETTKGMLDYYFSQMKVSKVTADVNLANVGSVKILEKFMKPVREFHNERDHCTDRRYEVQKSDWPY
ncbi:GNAT family N-acetyltransferase [Maribacter sp. 2307ULW6-5]|uniref:GNAT family N-acetyltransferase n=1 Tax=Maribacter sp. 2307ULW6-5 TaxID=3386275 RepID=UPI0039BC5514